VHINKGDARIHGHIRQYSWTWDAGTSKSTYSQILIFTYLQNHGLRLCTDYSRIHNDSLSTLYICCRPPSEAFWHPYMLLWKCCSPFLFCFHFYFNLQAVHTNFGGNRARGSVSARQHRRHNARQQRHFSVGTQSRQQQEQERRCT
jgi:hypothetical protein